MKKILYIAPFDDTHSVNGGYSKVAREFKRIFDSIQEQYSNDHEFTYTSYQNLIDQKLSLDEMFDKAIVLMHPSALISTNYNLISKCLSNCKERYLHIFWETLTLPTKWKGLFDSDLFTGFIVSSNFNKEVVEKHTTKPVELLYVPLNCNEYVDYKINIDDKVNNEKIFKILYVGQYTKRKGLEDAIIAFTNALGDRQDCELILKTYSLSNIEIPLEQMIQSAVYNNMRKENFKASVYTLQEDLAKEKMYRLYSSSSCLLFPSRGEGYGLPLVESNMLGIPCVYAYNSASQEAIDLNINYPVECYVDRSYGMAQYDYENSFYAVPTILQLEHNLKLAYKAWYTNRKEYYEKINQKYLIDNFGNNKSKENFIKFLEK